MGIKYLGLVVFRLCVVLSMWNRNMILGFGSLQASYGMEYVEQDMILDFWALCSTEYGEWDTILGFVSLQALCGTEYGEWEYNTWVWLPQASNCIVAASIQIGACYVCKQLLSSLISHSTTYSVGMNLHNSASCTSKAVLCRVLLREIRIKLAESQLQS